MSTLRPTLLPFLYPILYTPGKPVKITPAHLRRAKIALTYQRRPLSRSCNRWQHESRQKRYGTANEPLAHLGSDENPEIRRDASNSAKNPAAQPVTESSTSDASAAKSASPAERTTPSTAQLPPEPEKPASPESSQLPKPNLPVPPNSPEMETVLHMPSPLENAPHLKAPPYVHHFDTYSLVMRLAESGFKEDQAVTIMKAVRGLLTENMGVAKDALVSKSNVENVYVPNHGFVTYPLTGSAQETYLFKAACSELKTEIQKNRTGETEKMRTQRMQLQHEVDILGQRLTQESQSLKDDLKGLFNDRKMVVRMEQKNMEGQIQELNYKITVTLDSDARGDIEGLRWIAARRAAIAVFISAIMILSTLRYASYRSHNQGTEGKKKEKQDNDRKNGAKDERATGGQPLLREGTDDSVEGLIVAEGGGKGFVSLG